MSRRWTWLRIKSPSTAARAAAVVASHNDGETIYIFTDDAFGWRFFSVIFGTLGIIIFYFHLPQIEILR